MKLFIFSVLLCVTGAGVTLLVPPLPKLNTFENQLDTVLIIPLLFLLEDEFLLPLEEDEFLLLDELLLFDLNKLLNMSLKFGNSIVGNCIFFIVPITEVTFLPISAISSPVLLTTFLFSVSRLSTSFLVFLIYHSFFKIPLNFN